MARLVLFEEWLRVLDDFSNADYGGAGALLQLGAEGNRLAAIGIGIGGLGGGLRIGDVFGNDAQTRRLGRKARGCDLQCALQGIGRHDYPFATDSVMRWNAFTMLVLSEYSRAISPAFIISCSTSTVLPEWVCSVMSSGRRRVAAIPSA